MLVMFVGTDRTETAVNASQVTFVSSVNDGTRIRFGEGRSVTVTEPRFVKIVLSWAVASNLGRGAFLN